MNWKDLHEKHPAAFLEWVQSDMKNVVSLTPFAANIANSSLRYTTIKGREAILTFNNNDLLKLPHYFDGLGIIVLPEYEVSEKVFNCTVINTIGRRRISMASMGFEFPDRLAALKAGIEKAFEIREGQLKQLTRE